MVKNALVKAGSAVGAHMRLLLLIAILLGILYAYRKEISKVLAGG